MIKTPELVTTESFELNPRSWLPWVLETISEVCFVLRKNSKIWQGDGRIQWKEISSIILRFGWITKLNVTDSVLLFSCSAWAVQNVGHCLGMYDMRLGTDVLFSHTQSWANYHLIISWKSHPLFHLQLESLKGDLPSLGIRFSNMRGVNIYFLVFFKWWWSLQLKLVGMEKLFQACVNDIFSPCPNSALCQEVIPVEGESLCHLLKNKHQYRGLSPTWQPNKSANSLFMACKWKLCEIIY